MDISKLHMYWFRVTWRDHHVMTTAFNPLSYNLRPHKNVFPFKIHLFFRINFILPTPPACWFSNCQLPSSIFSTWCVLNQLDSPIHISLDYPIASPSIVNQQSTIWQLVFWPCNLFFMLSKFPLQSSSPASWDVDNRENISSSVSSSALQWQKLPNFKMPLPSSRIYEKQKQRYCDHIIKTRYILYCLSFNHINTYTNLSRGQVGKNYPQFMDVFQAFDQVPSKPPHHILWQTSILTNHRRQGTT